MPKCIGSYSLVVLWTDLTYTNSNEWKYQILKWFEFHYIYINIDKNMTEACAANIAISPTKIEM